MCKLNKTFSKWVTLKRDKSAGSGQSKHVTANRRSKRGWVENCKKRTAAVMHAIWPASKILGARDRALRRRPRVAS